MSVGVRITYRQLLERHNRVRVPMIQRDYAQGRPGEAEIRQEFLGAIRTALRKDPDDPSLPLNLDFVYGSVEGADSSFLPLDGQQRLTTLFLLHWYLAWVDSCWDDFTAMFQTSEGLSRFSYRVRPSSNEFFDELVKFEPVPHPSEVTSLSALVQDQPWYFRSWRLDPTIQSVLGMLDALHVMFSASTNLYARLNDSSSPAVTFQLLDLENFGLSDDLYIKMNARGKPLTAFETFKARYEQELQKQFKGVLFAIGNQQFSASDYVSIRLDTTWGDLFWELRDTKSHAYDAALMNLFRAVALVSRDPDSATHAQDVTELRLRSPNYSDFHQRGWLDERFTMTLLRLLDAWEPVAGKLRPLLPSPQYFDEGTVFGRLASIGGNLPYTDLVQFSAYAFFVRDNHKKFDQTACERWMRVVHNLAINTGYNRSEDMRRSIVGLAGIMMHADRIEEYLADATNQIVGFNEPQIVEERLKARLVLSDPAWRPLLERAECHGYLRGQVEFLLDFSGVVAAAKEQSPSLWPDALSSDLKQRFAVQCRLAEAMFSGQGLRDVGDHRWQRALLSIGDYLLPSGRNLSFLASSPTEEGSWKRLLRGGPVAARRDLLRRLWSQLSPNDPVAPQLDRIIQSAVDIEPWRDAFIRTPSAITYCVNHCIRWVGETLFLLKRLQLNGAHVELFTYCFYVRSGSSPVAFPSSSLAYVAVTDTYADPYISVAPKQKSSAPPFCLQHLNGQFVLHVTKALVANVDGLDARLSGLGFNFDEVRWSQSVDHENLSTSIGDLDAIFSALSS